MYHRWRGCHLLVLLLVGPAVVGCELKFHAALTCSADPDCGPDLACQQGVCVACVGCSALDAGPSTDGGLDGGGDGGVDAGCTPTETACGDGVDNDCDGFTDCADSDCAGQSCGSALRCFGQVCSACGGAFDFTLAVAAPSGSGGLDGGALTLLSTGCSALDDGVPVFTGPGSGGGFFSGTALGTSVVGTGLAARVTVPLDAGSFSLTEVIPWELTYDTLTMGQGLGPGLGDLDGDGDLDLLLGWNSSLIAAYENTGTRTAPVWTRKPAWDATMTSCTTFAGDRPHTQPSLADLDGDGDLDFITGSFTNCVEAFENTGTSAAPVWVRHPSWEPPVSMDMTNVALGDLDGDGKVDLLVGYNSEKVPYNMEGFRNTGTLASPAWTRQPAWDLAFSVYQCCGSQAPELGDLDNDGDLDLVIFENTTTTGVGVYENIGTRTAPVWARNTGWSNAVVGDNGWFVAMALGDLDGDGRLDFVEGQRSYTVYCTGQGCNPFVWRNLSLPQTGGTFESATLDLGGPGPALAKIRLRPRESAPGDVAVQVASAVSSAGPWTYLNLDGTAGAPAPTTALASSNPSCQVLAGPPTDVVCVPSASLDSQSHGRFLRYRASLAAPQDGGVLPALDELQVTYSLPASTSVLSGLTFDAQHAQVRWVSVAWVRADAQSTGVSVQVRVAASQALLSAATWAPDVFSGAAAACTDTPGVFGVADPVRHTVSCDLSAAALRALLEAGPNQFMELQLTLDGTTGASPAVESARASFVEPGATAAACQ